MFYTSFIVIVTVFCCRRRCVFFGVYLRAYRGRALPKKHNGTIAVNTIKMKQCGATLVSFASTVLFNLEHKQVLVIIYVVLVFSDIAIFMMIRWPYGPINNFILPSNDSDQKKSLGYRVKGCNHHHQKWWYVHFYYYFDISDSPANIILELFPF